MSNFFLQDRVDCNDFVLFVCFFLFYPIEDILNILISMIRINSKLFITQEQVNQFFETFNLDIYKYDELRYVLDLSKPTLPEYI